MNMCMTKNMTVTICRNAWKGKEGGNLMREEREDNDGRKMGMIDEAGMTEG